MYDIAARIVDGQAVEVNLANHRTYTTSEGKTYSVKSILKNWSPAKIQAVTGVFVHNWPETPEGQDVDTQTITVVDGEVVFERTYTDKPGALTNNQVLQAVADAVKDEALEKYVDIAEKLVKDRRNPPTRAQIKSFLEGMDENFKDALIKANNGF